MIPDVSLLAAFFAGVVSISSPCCLPLVPIYLSHLAGVSAGEGSLGLRGRVLVNAVAYVVGFSVVFILLGVALGAAGTLVSTGSLVSNNRVWLVRIGGILLVLLGLHQIGVIRIPWLDTEHRVQLDRVPAGHVASSFVIGATFAAGWSPCLGPILGAILTMAASQGSPNRAGILLAAYAAGMSLPFLAAAVAFGRSQSIIRRLNRRLHMVTSVSGAVMLGVGMVMLLGLYQEFFARIVASAPWTPWEPHL